MPKRHLPVQAEILLSQLRREAFLEKQCLDDDLASPPQGDLLSSLRSPQISYSPTPAEAHPCHTRCAEGRGRIHASGHTRPSSSATTGHYVASNPRDSSSLRLGQLED